MPKPVARAKTRKAFAKRMKITGSGKVLRNKPGTRHLLSSKNAKRRRRLGQRGLVSDSDLRRVREALPFS